MEQNKREQQLTMERWQDAGSQEAAGKVWDIGALAGNDTGTS